MTEKKENLCLDLIGVIKNFNEIKGYTPDVNTLAFYVERGSYYVRELTKQLSDLGLIKRVANYREDRNQVLFEVTKLGQECLDKNRIVGEL